jgi:hypothetical protein
MFFWGRQRFTTIAFLASVLLTAWLASGCLENVGGTSVTPYPNTTQSAPPLSGTGGGSTITTASPTPTSSTTTGENILSVTVGEGSSGVCEGLNQPCASVTICTPGTTNCQTINNVLVDTGSYGLRLFSSVVTISLPQITNTSGVGVAECAEFGTGSDWGPVMSANVQLGSEPQVTVPIQLIESTYASIPSSSGCASADTSPTEAGFNGILGVGLFVQDCGSTCTSSTSPDMYYACNGSTCTGTTLSLANQVANPVASLPTDNNGVILSLPAISSSGTASLTGSLYFGIGTQSNNTPSGVTTYLANGYGEFNTVLNGTTYSESFIDSGSNGLFFPTPTGLVSCSDSDPYAPGWFCPASTTSYSATNESYNESYSSSSPHVTFSIANADTLVQTGYHVFNDIGASSGVSSFTASFDWGLPFFLGRNVYVGFEGKSSSTLNVTGPYWAY